MRPGISVVAALIITSGVAWAESGEATKYEVKSARSTLDVVIRNDTSAMLSRLGHDHVIRATAVTGTVTWPSTPGGPCRVEVSVPVKSLVVDPPGSRERHGLDDNTVSESDKVKLSANMWGRSQLHADAHPQVTFRADSCPGGSGRVPVTGTFSVRGVERPLTITMNVRADGSTFSASGRFSTTHTAHDFKPFAGSAFGPRNQDALDFTLEIGGMAPQRSEAPVSER